MFDEERLIERAAELGDRLIEGLRQRIGGSEFVHDVRGKGLMIAIEFGAPSSLKLKAAYALIERANRGLFCQLILLPLFKRHRILAQVAGHNLPVIKLLPAYVIDDADLAWIENAFAETLEDSRSVGSFWDMGRMLATQAMKAKAGAA